MSLEKILNTIIEDAQAEAVDIIKESQSKAEEIKEMARQEALELAQAIHTEEERQGHLEASRLVTQARLEGRINILSTKKKLIEDVLANALDRERNRIERLKKQVIMKEGEREEAFDESRLLDEIRPQLEKFINDILKL
jgi:glycerol-3-phosphate cytidylyltransferase-like family protein